MNNQPTAHTCAYSTKCEACACPSFETTYELVDAEGDHLVPGPGFATIAEVTAAGVTSLLSVVAVVNGWVRELTADEKAEFKECLKLRLSKAELVAHGAINAYP